MFTVYLLYFVSIIIHFISLLFVFFRLLDSRGSSAKYSCHSADLHLSGTIRWLASVASSNVLD